MDVMLTHTKFLTASDLITKSRDSFSVVAIEAWVFPSDSLVLHCAK